MTKWCYILYIGLCQIVLLVYKFFVNIKSMLGIGEPKDLLNALRNQTKDTPPDMVYVIDVLSVRFGGYFTPEIRS